MRARRTRLDRNAACASALAAGLALAVLAAAARAGDGAVASASDVLGAREATVLRVAGGGDVFARAEDATLVARAGREGWMTLWCVDPAGRLRALPIDGARARRVRAGETVSCAGATRSRAQGIAWAFAVVSDERPEFARAGARAPEAGDPFGVVARALASAGVRSSGADVAATRFYVGRWERVPRYVCARHRVHRANAPRCLDCVRRYVREADAPGQAVRERLRSIESAAVTAAAAPPDGAELAARSDRPHAGTRSVADGPSRAEAPNEEATNAAR